MQGPGEGVGLAYLRSSEDKVAGAESTGRVGRGEVRELRGASSSLGLCRLP